MSDHKRGPAKRKTNRTTVAKCAADQGGGGAYAGTGGGALPRTKSTIPEDLELTERINRVCGGLFRWLGFLQMYEVIYRFEEELVDEVGGVEYTAEIKRRYPYRTVFITWSRKKLRDKTDAEIERYGTHEASHELLFGDFERNLGDRLGDLPLKVADEQELRDRVTEWSEDVIDRMAHLLARARPPGGYGPDGTPLFN